MSEILFVTPQEIAKTTILGGNVDPDKFVVNIAMAQMSVIEPLLGTELYDKIEAGVEAGDLAGNYLILYNKYVVPITKHEALAEYIEVSNYMVDNGGTFKHTADNREVTSKDELLFLSGKYHNLAQMYIKRFNKWICKNQLDEYKRYQDDVNAQNVEVKSGWYFGSSNVDNWEIA